MRIEEGCYALQLLMKGPNEKLRAEVATERENVMLYHIIGYNNKKNYKRTLGYALLYLGTPYVHAHTWYMGVAYSAPKQTGQKDWSVLYTDDEVRLTQAGIGDIDYLLTYLRRTDEHDERGLSDGAVRMATSKNWKDGL